MTTLVRRAISAAVSFAIAFGPPAQAFADANDTYFRYRVDGVEASGIDVRLRGPSAPVLTGSQVAVETRVIGGSPPYRFSLDQGTLPSGVTVAADTGLVKGAASTSGSFEFAVRVTDASGTSAASLPFVLVVRDQQLEVSRFPSLSAQLATAYADRFAAVGGREPYSWSVFGGALPKGIVLGARDGSLAGIPTAVGQYPFRVQVQDAAGATAVSGQVVLFVDAATLAIAGSAPSRGNVGLHYAGRFTATGGAAPYTYVLPAGSLPPGIALDGATGWLSGTPTAPGLYPNIRVRAVDATNRSVDGTAFSIQVFADLGAAWVGGSAVRDVAYSGPIQTVGGRAPYAYALTEGALPQGLALNAGTGSISGVPTVGGTYDGLDVRVTDAEGRSVQTGPFAIDVSNKLTIVSAPSRAAVVFQGYSSGFATGGGTRPYAYRLAAGTLPQGLSLNGSTGIVAGSPGAVGTASGLKVEVTDAKGDKATSPVFDIDVRAPVLVSTRGVPAFGTVGQSFAGAISVTGGLSPYLTSLQGSLPAGILFDTVSGAFSGTPVAATSVEGLTVTAQDADGRTGISPAFGIRVSQPLTAGLPTTLASVGTPYSSAISVTGGRSPYAFSVAPSIPAGLRLDAATGAITGTPTAPGVTAGFKATVKDADGRVASTSARDFVVVQPLAVAGPTRSFATTGQSYADAVVASGGTAPYVYAVAGGALPQGLSLDPQTGTVSGTPARADNAAFTIGVADAAGLTATTPTGIAVSDPLSAPATPSGIADLGRSYSSSASTKGGRAPYAWTVAAGALPSGLGLDAASGAVSGIPGAEGVSTAIVLHVVDADGRAADTAPFSIDVRRPLSLTGSAPAQAASGEAYVAQFAADGGTQPYAWTLSSGRLPGGLALDGARGLVSGTPLQGGEYAVAVSVTDAVGRVASSATFPISVSSDFTIVDGPLPTDPTVGQALTRTFQVRGGVAPATFSVMSGTLPAGLTLTSGGVLSGTPVRAGSSEGIVIAARDAGGRVSTTTTFAMDVRNPPSITGSPAAGATFNRPYSARFDVAGGRGPFSFAVGPNAFPPGLSIGAAIEAETKVVYGAMGGIPTGVGTFPNLVVVATDAAGRTASSAPFDIQVIDRFAVTANLPAGPTVGAPYSGSVVAADGQPPYVYAIASGDLPDGLQLDASTGAVSGRPTAAGATYVSFASTDARGRVVTSDSVSIDVRAPLSYALAPPAFAIVGESYSAPASVSGGRGPFWVLQKNGLLPPGLSFDAAGNLSGTPTRSGGYGATLSLNDADGRASPDVTLLQDVAERLTLAGSTPPAATRGKAYSGGFSASGGHSPYVYALASGSLPNGLSLDASAGSISGTPGKVETASGISITATDRDGRTATSSTFGIDISDNPSFSASPGGWPTVGQPYAASSAVVGGRPPYSYALASGALPDGLALDASTGAVSGTPSASGSRSLTLVVSDSLGATGQAGFTLDVRAQLGSSGSFAAAATAGRFYSSSVQITGGRTPYTASLASGALPSGLRLMVEGGSVDLSGTPSQTGGSTFTLALADADGRTAQGGPFEIDTRAPVSVGGSMPAVTVGHAYAAPFAAAGGRAPYGYAVSTGTLPTGLALDPVSGLVSGTPSASGSFRGIVVAATDADGRRGSTDPQAITVRDRISAAASAAVSYGTVGAAFSRPAAFSGGRAPYVYALGAGALPDGLSLDPASGAIAGTPAATGSTAGLRVDATDADGDRAVGSTFSLDVRTPVAIQAPDTILVSSQTDGIWGGVVATGGSGNYAFAVASGSLPAGLTLDATTGQVKGVAPTPANTVATILATDDQGRTAQSGAISIKAAAVVTGTFAAPAQAVVGRSFSAQPATATGGTLPYVYAVVSGGLPAGLSLDAATGRVSGTPTAAAATAPTIRVTDADGRHVDGTYQLTTFQPLSTTYPNTGRGAFVVGSKGVYAPTTVGGCTPVSSRIYAGGTPPTGIAFAPDGSFTNGGDLGLPAGSYNFVVRTSDNCSQTVDSSITLNVANTAPTVSAPTRLNMVRGVATTLPRPTVGGGTAPFSYDTVAALPGGLSIDPSTGAISGTVQDVAGTTYGPISLLVTDAFGRQGQSSSFSVTVVNPLSVSFSTSALPFTAGVSSSYPPVVSGGCGTLAWTLSGSRPTALTFDAATGTLSNGGLLAADVGTYGPLTVGATDACGLQSAANVTADVRGGAPSAVAPSNLRLPIGQSVSTGPATASNMASPSFALSSGSLPSYLALDAASGTISGTIPNGTASGTSWRLVLQASDAFGRTAATSAFDLMAVSRPALSYANAGMIGWTTGRAATAAPVVTGGCSVVSYRSTGTTLPTGLALDASSGSLSGSIATDGAYGPYTVQLTDACGQTASAQVTLDARTGTPTALAPSQRILDIGLATRTDAVTWSGFAPSATVALSGAALPSGISLDAAYRLVGTLPASTAAGTTFGPYGITVSDGFGRSATSSNFNLTAAAAPTITYATTSYLTVGSSTTIQPTVKGGATPYTYALTAGTLPGGLTFSTATGQISGTPTTAGSATGLQVTATDAAGGAAVSNTFATASAAPVAVSGSPTAATMSKAYTYAFSASGGAAPYVFTTSGTLPPGLTMASSGVLSGTPTTQGTYAFSVVATDSGSRSNLANVSLTVGAGSTGYLYGWGPASYLGNGSAGATGAISRAGGNLLYQRASPGYRYSCGVTTSSDGYCWGFNGNGQLGNGDTSGAFKDTPSLVAGGMKWLQIEAGYLHTCGITTEGKLYCWGNNQYAQIGTGSGGAALNATPIAVGTGVTAGFTKLFMGSLTTTCALSGTDAYCWGGNTGGASGTGSSSSALVPTKIAGSYTTLTVGDQFGCGITTAGALNCWGSYPGTSATPVPFAGAAGSTWLSISSIGASACAIRSDNRMFCFGSNPSTGYLIGDGKAASPIAVGNFSTPREIYGGGQWASISGVFCGNRMDGSIACWAGAPAPAATSRGDGPGVITANTLNLQNATGSTNGYGIQ